MGTVTKLNDVLCGSISKVDDVLKANASKWDENTFCATCIEGHIPKETEFLYRECCYPFLQITGTSGSETTGYTVCFNPTYNRINVTAVSPQVICDTSVLTRCCEIQLGYSEFDPSNACTDTLDTYYISVPCLATSCDLSGALAVYTDDSCTLLAPEGYYSDGTDYGTQGALSFTFNGPCF